VLLINDNRDDMALKWC